jgi:hypothetical protein
MVVDYARMQRLGKKESFLGLHVFDRTAHLVSFWQMAVVAQAVHQCGHEILPWLSLMLGTVDLTGRLAAEIVRTGTGKIRTSGHLDKLSSRQEGGGTG